MKLEIKNLFKSYGEVKAVSGIDLKIQENTIFGFIGPNGAGKSTTIRCILNLINYEQGEIYYDNQILDPKNMNVKKEISYLPSEINLYEELKVIDIIKYNDAFYDYDCLEYAKELANMFELDTSKKIEDLSLGNLKKVGIVLSVMSRPKLLILDEPTSGLDPLMQNRFHDLLLNLKKQGTTILLSTHILSEIKQVCDEYAIIKSGKIMKVDSVKNIDSHFVNINFISADYQNIINELDIKVKSQSGNEVHGIYSGKSADLIKILAKYNIEKILIEEPSIEEIFINYYE